ncbi:hypothetical protein A2Z67_02315 [Candidatus Woesebacteria bacterium RBG_13_36_22]|uniref:Uncharacterized protein n=1 Tax=Candidatus Woesebacteria bacterium RBG_13_36_22 TaxID=1802478 RepID=A0A1F7X361_9BACT|nr:MAG: hypothetical protein A2Z67_02315 [Candidatus Woesebacteria bacterium RBG_13_36_22]
MPEGVLDYHIRMQQRRDASTNWTSINPVLLNGEIGIETDNTSDYKWKIGDGSHCWTDLPYMCTATGGGGTGQVFIKGSGSSVFTSGTIEFATGNNVTFGLTGSTMTASASFDGIADSISTQWPNRAYLVGVNTLGTTSFTSIQSLYLSGDQNITLSGGGNTIKFIAATAFSNSSQLTATFLTTAAQVSHSHGAMSMSLESIAGTFSTASNGFTISLTGSTHPHDYIPLANSTDYATSILDNTFAIISHSHGAISLSLDGISGTYSSASNGLTMSLTNSTHAHSFVNQINGSSGSISFNTASSLSSSANASGITFGLASNISTAWSGQTTANQSRVLDFNGSSGQISFVTGSGMSTTTNASTLTFGLRSDISTAWSGQTTANQSRVIAFNGSSGQISLVTGSGMSTTTNASTLTFGLRSDISTAWSGQTTANQSRVIQINGSSGSISLNTGSSLSSSANASGITFGLASNISTALMPIGYSSGFQTATLSNTFAQTGHTHSDLYIALASSTRSAGINTSVSSGYAGSTLAFSANSSGITMSIPAWITTAGAGGGIQVTLSGNTSGTLAAISSGTLTLAGGNNITLSQVGNAVTISGANVGGVQTGISGLGNSQTTYSSGTVLFSEQSNITINSSVNGASQYIRLSVADAIGLGSSTRFAGINTSSSSTGGSDLKFSLNSSGATFSVPAWLTTAYRSTSEFSASFLNTGEAHIRQIEAQNFIRSSGSIFISGSRNITVSGDGTSILSVVGPENILSSFYIAGNSGTTNSSKISGGGFVLAGGSNITLSQSNNIISIHGGVGGAISASNGSSSLGTVAFGSSNNMHFYYTMNSVVASFVESTHAHSFVNQLNGSSGSLTISASDNITISNDNGTIFIKAGGGGGSWELEGTKTAGTTGSAFSTLYLQGGNNVTLSGNSNTIIFSVADAAGQSQQPMYFSGSNVSTSANTMIFGNSNNISHYITNGSLVASMSESTHAHSFVNQINGSSGSISFNTASSLSSSANASGITFGLASNISTAWSGQTTANQSRVVQINGSSGTISFGTASSLSSSTNASGITFGLASNITSALQSYNANYLTSQSNQAFSADVSSTFQTLTFQNSNGVSFSNNAGALRITHDLQYSSNTSNITANAMNTNERASFVYKSNLAASNSAGSFTFQTLNFSNANNVTWGTSAGSIVTASVAAPGAAAESNWMSLSGNIAGNSSASGSTIMWIAGNNITLSGTNGSQIRIDGAAGAGFALKGSGTYTQNSGTIEFSNSNSVTFGLTNNVMTASVGRGSVYFTNGSNITWDLSVDGISTSIYLTAGGGTGGADGGNIIAVSGATANSTGSVVFLNSNSITFGMSDSTQITASFSHPHPYINTSESGNLYFSNGSGISWGTSVSCLSTTLTGSIATTYAGTGFTTGTTGGSVIEGTLNTSGLSMKVPAFGGSGGIQATMSGNTSGTLAAISSGTWTLAGGNNITLSQVGNAVTISGANVGGAQTGISGLGNSETTYSSGTVLLSAYSNLTISSSVNGASQYMRFSIADAIGLGSSTRFAGINTSSSSTGGSDLKFSLNSSGATFSVPVWLITAAQSNQVVNSFNGSTGQINLVTGSGMSTTTNASTLTFGLRSDISTAWSGQTTANSARVISINGTSGVLSISGASNITVSVLNGSTITIYGPSNILNSFSIGGNTGTTNSSNITGGGFVLAGGNNISLSQSNNTISIIGGAGGGAAISAVGSSQNTGTVVFSNSNSVSFGMNGSTITADVGGRGNVYFQDASGISWSSSVNSVSTSISGIFNATGTSVSSGYAGSTMAFSINTGGITMSVPAWRTDAGGGGVAISAAGSSVSNGTVVFSNSNGISFGMNGNTVTGSHNAISKYNLVGDNTLGITSGTFSGDIVYFSGMNNITINGAGGGSIGIQGAMGFTSTSEFSASFLNTGEAHIRRIQASNTSYTSGTIEFSASRNLSVSYNASTISFYGPANILNSFSIGGNTGTTNSSAISGGGFVIAGGSNITLSQSNATISIHAGAGGGGVALGNTASSNAFTSGSVMLSGVNLTVNTSANGASQYLQISAPSIGYLFFSNTNGHSWSSSVSSVSTSIYVVTA